MAKKCFVIMPFRDPDKNDASEEKWNRIFDFFKECVETATQGAYEVCRSEANTGSITNEIIRNLDQADIVIADCTGRNGNVFYELGIRHCRRIGTILVAQDRKDFPFDLQDEASHIYEYESENEKNVFIARIKKLIDYVEKHLSKADSKVGELLGYAGSQSSKISNMRLDSITRKMGDLQANEKEAIKYMLTENVPVSNQDLYEKFKLMPDRYFELEKTGLIHSVSVGTGTFLFESGKSSNIRTYEINPPKKQDLERYFEND
ncbi:MAG TPA: hypothetical protein PKH33_15940 [bacterium]|nr:hypothetical protein [bacterium]